MGNWNPLNWFKNREANNNEDRALKRQEYWDKTNERAQSFLKSYAGRRGGATAAAAAGSSGASTAEKAASAFGQMGDDIQIQKGYRDPGFTVAGQKGRRGFLGRAAGIVGAFNPVAGAVMGGVDDMMYG